MNSSVNVGLFIKNAVTVQTSQLDALNEIHLSLFAELVKTLPPSRTATANEMEQVLRLKPAGAKSPYLRMEDRQADLRVTTDAEAVESAVIFDDFKGDSSGASSTSVLFVPYGSLVKPLPQQGITESVDFTDHRPLDISLSAFRSEARLAENLYRDQEDKPTREFKTQTLFIQLLNEYNVLLSEYAKMFSKPPANSAQLRIIFETKKQIFAYRLMFDKHHDAEQKKDINTRPAVDPELQRQMVLFQARRLPTQAPDMTNEASECVPDPYSYKTVTISKVHIVNFNLLEEYYISRAADSNIFVGGTGVDRTTKLHLALLCFDCYVKEGKVSDVLKAQVNRGAGFGNKLGNRIDQIERNLANPYFESTVSMGVGSKNWFI